MKKVTLILVSCLLFIIMATTACKQEQFHGWAPPIRGLHWGMKEDGVIKTMGLKPEDFERTEEDTRALVTIKKEYDIYGTTTAISLSFFNHRLTAISAKVKDEDIDGVDKRLSEELGEGDYRYSENTDSSGKDVVSVYRYDICIKEDPNLYELIKKTYLDSDFDLLKHIIPLKNSLGELPLTTCEFNLDMTSTGYGFLTIDGKAAAMLNYPKMLSKKD